MRITDYFRKGNYLVSKANNICVLMPQGLIKEDPNMEFEYSIANGKESLVAKLHDESSIVLPVCQIIKTTIKGVRLTIQIARFFKEIQAGKKVLLNHYKKLPEKGLFVNAYIDNNFDDPVACGCIDRLYYTKPIGRRKIAELAGKDALWESMGKDQSVNELRVAWISRLAVKPTHQRKGIASTLAEAMCEIAHDFMLPHADFMEVFMSFASDKKKKDTNEESFKDNLYWQAGFEYYNRALRTSKMVFPERENEGYISAVKKYYYCDLRALERKKQFLALNSDPFNWFKNGKKEWELRKKKSIQKRGFSTGQIVRLCRGYSYKNGILWGRIIEIREFASLNDVFANIEYKNIIDVNNEDLATQQIQKILGISLDDLIEIIAIRFKIINIVGELLFEDGFFSLISDGKKTSTIFYDDYQYTRGYYNAYDNDKRHCILLRVCTIHRIKFNEFTDENAITEGFSSLQELKDQLVQRHPDLNDESQLTIIYFKEV